MFTHYLSHTKRHVFVAGDIHGCYSLLMQKLDEHNFDNDLLISVGDLILIKVLKILIVCHLSMNHGSL